MFAHKNQSLLPSSILVLTGMMASSALFAQAANPGEGATDKKTSTAAGTLEDIVVTARRINEVLQSTPVAVTAITAEAMASGQMAQVVDLQRTAPNLNLGMGGSGAPSSLLWMSIRGQTQVSPNSFSDSAVGIYIDGVYIARPVVSNGGFLDVDRVEVLRGPQGTLFGRNTTGGALNVTSAAPTGEFEGYAKTGFGNYGSKVGEIVLNVPIMGDELATRAAFRYSDHDAYFTNPINGNDPMELEHDYVGRAQVRWAPSDLPLTLTFSGDYANMRDTGQSDVLSAVNYDLAPLPIPITLGQMLGIAQARGVPNHNLNAFLATHANDRSTFVDTRTPDEGINTAYDRNISKGLSANLDADIAAVHLKSISAFRESKTSNAKDLDGTPAQLVGFTSAYDNEQFSEEIQVSGTAGKLDWIGGLYYFREAGTERTRSQSFGLLTDIDFNAVLNSLNVLPFTLATPTGAMGVRLDDGEYVSKSRAAFAQFNYHVTDDVRLTAGYRYTWDKRTIDRHSIDDIFATQNVFTPFPAGTAICAVPFGSVGVLPPCNDPHDASFSYPAYLFGADWQVNDNLFVYIKTSRASMAGGFNSRPTPPGADSFKPETNEDVEVGLKADLLDRRLRTNVALFHGWQSDVQRLITNLVNGQVTQYSGNAGDARTYGAELEITWLPWQGMELAASGAYLDGEYKKGTYTGLQQYSTAATAPVPGGCTAAPAAAPGVNTLTCTVDRSDEPLPRASKWSYNLGATQSFPVLNGNLELHLDYSWRDAYVTQWDTPAPGRPDVAQWNLANQLSIVPSYGLLNGRVAFTLDNPNLELAVWARNLADKHYATEVTSFYVNAGFATQTPGFPRTYGATLQYNF